MINLLIAVLIILIIITTISGAFLMRRRAASSPRIFVFHSLVTKPLDFSSISITRFRSFLDAVDARGLQIARIEDCLRDRTKVAVTFDDGYEDLMQLVPLLRERSFPATIFMPTAFIGKTNSWDNFIQSGNRRHLSVAQIRELATLGVEFGSHGHTHRDLCALSADRVRDELTQSRQHLREITGREVGAIAFPFGLHNDSVVEVARELGYRVLLGSSQQAAASNAKQRILGRIAISKLDNRIAIKSKLGDNLFTGIEMLKSSIISKFSHLTPLTKGK